VKTGLSHRQAAIVLLAMGGVALTGVFSVAGLSDVATFVLAALALAGVAWIVSYAVDAMSAHLAPALTGILQSTAGNMPEFFLVLFALRAGQLVVAETSLLGSLFANALLVMGAVIVVGSRASRDGVMRFKARLPKDTSTLLLLAVYLIALLGLSTRAGDRAGQHPEVISVVGALCLLAVYGIWLPRYLTEREQAGVEDRPAERGEGGMPLSSALGLLALGGVGSALASDWFVKALEPSLPALHLSKTFAGLVIAAIAGNAAENVAGIIQAGKGRADLAISLVENSVSQVALFLFPLLVLVSLLFSSHLTFLVNPVFIGALVLMAISLWQITGDGQAYAFEGAALIALYAILALIAFYD
jgi:Ca2+:H+ antiporter